MTDDKVVFDGKTYKATKAGAPGSCEGCAFYELWRGCVASRCSATDRGDGIDVIYIEESK